MELVLSCVNLVLEPLSIIQMVTIVQDNKLLIMFLFEAIQPDCTVELGLCSLHTKKIAAILDRAAGGLQ